MEYIQDITKLLNIKYPIIQAGMVWTSGAKLAAASANAGCLGVVGAGSMQPPLLKEHLKEAQSLLGQRPEYMPRLGVNVPLLYPKAEEQIQTALDAGIKIFLTSAGSPKKWTPMLKKNGCTVIHVVSTPAFAKKAEDAGCDAVVAEGFEAGGHNGRDEITTMVLVPQCVDAVNIPVIAAGGIGDGRGIVAALALGAKGVQLGTRFLMTQESSAHPAFKKLIASAAYDATTLAMKRLVPVRLMKNQFAARILALEEAGASVEKLAEALGKGRAKKGIFEGDLDEGELEIGQVSGLIQDLPTVKDMVQGLVQQAEESYQGRNLRWLETAK